MTYGWNTKKTGDGYEWKIEKTVWDAEAGKAITTTVKSGTRQTRAKAAFTAKKWVLFFRRGGSLENANEIVG